MTQRLTAQEFQARDGVAEWRVGDAGARATFDTGSFARGVEFVNEIGRLAEAANHHPDVELTYPSVTVRLITHDEGDAGAVTDRDASLAAQISAAASRLGLSATGS